MKVAGSMAAAATNDGDTGAGEGVDQDPSQPEEGGNQNAHPLQGEEGEGGEKRKAEEDAVGSGDGTTGSRGRGKKARVNVRNLAGEDFQDAPKEGSTDGFSLPVFERAREAEYLYNLSRECEDNKAQWANLSFTGPALRLFNGFAALLPCSNPVCTKVSYRFAVHPSSFLWPDNDPSRPPWFFAAEPMLALCAFRQGRIGRQSGRWE